MLFAKCKRANYWRVYQVFASLPKGQSQKQLHNLSDKLNSGRLVYFPKPPLGEVVVPNSTARCRYHVWSIDAGGNSSGLFAGSK